MKIMMNSIVAAIEYDGTLFQGSQIQPNTRTVQGEFNSALNLIHKKEFFLNLQVELILEFMLQGKL